MKSRNSIARLTFSIMGVVLLSFGFLVLSDYLGNRTLNSLARARGTLAALRELQVATHSLQAERTGLHDTVMEWKAARDAFGADIQALKAVSLGSRQNDARIERIAQTWSRMEELDRRVEDTLDKLAHRGVFERIGPAGLLLGYDRSLSDVTFAGEDVRDLGFILLELEDFDHTAGEVNAELQSITNNLSVEAHDDYLRKVLAQTLAFLTTLVGSSALLLRLTRLYHQLEADNVRREAAEAAARSSEEDLRITLNSIGDAVIATDLRDRVVRLNPVAEQLTGWKSAEALGRPLAEIYRVIRPATGAGADENKFLNRVIAARLVRRDGTEKHIAENAAPLRNARGDSLGAVHVFRDVTEQLHLQEQLWQSQRLDSIGKLAGGVAHDFNNLLTVIQGHLTLIGLDSTVGSESRESLGEISSAATRAANLTQQLLTFSRRQKIRLVPLDLNEVVYHLFKLLRRTVNESISLGVCYAGQAVPVQADVSMMEQVLLNLVINARDAMPAGGQITIETSLVEVDAATAARIPDAQPGAFACFSVTDTGSGMTPEIMKKAFEPFFTTKEIGKGTGLGLATVHGIVRQHKGWIQVISEVGRGSTFRVCLPRLVGQLPAETTVPAVDGKSPDGSHETLLLVEDEPALRKLIQRDLRRRGYHVLEAASGALALDIWKQHRTDIRLLITDMVMPDGVSGLELAQKLLADNPQLKVIYTSGYSPDIAVGDFQPQEGVNFLAKPFGSDQLAALIQKNLASNGPLRPR